MGGSGKNLDDILESALAEFEDDDEEGLSTSTSTVHPPRGPSSAAASVPRGSNSSARSDKPSASSFDDADDGGGGGGDDDDDDGDDGFNDAPNAPVFDEKDLDEFSKQFQNILSGLLGAQGGGAIPGLGGVGGVSASRHAARVPEREDDFGDEDEASGQENVDESLRSALEQLKSAAAAASSGDPAAGLPQDLLADMQNMESDPAFAQILQTMMNQLLSKDVLYGPMSELSDKFPHWLSSNVGKLKPEEVDNYRQQIVLINRVVALYDQDAPMDRVVEVMTELQALGQPPKELLDSIGGALPGAVPNPFNDESCKMQ
eukprot:ANDGO_02175.mRNA.1 Peroxisome biogenesis protein 19-1